MKLKRPTPKTFRRWLLAAALIVIVGMGIGGFEGRAAAATMDYDAFKSKVDTAAAKYCASLQGTLDYDTCTEQYTRGAVMVYNSTSKQNVQSGIQINCVLPVATFTASQLNPCDTFKSGVTGAQGILGKPFGGTKNTQAPKQGSSQKKTQSTPKPPPITECNKVKDADKRKKCKQDYRDCNRYNGTKERECKKDVIDHFVNGGGSSSGGSSGSRSGSGSGSGSSSPCNSSGNCDLVAKYVNPSINLLSALFGLVAVASLILGGINYTTSEGDPQKAAQAKNRIYGTLVAIFAYLLLYAFLQFLIPGGLFR